MKRSSNLNCPNCESQLDRETCPQSEGWLAEWADYKLLQCPCCNFFVENSSKPCAGWKELEAVAMEQGAKHAQKAVI